MRFMVLVKASKESEAGVLPDEQILSAMAKYNEDLVKIWQCKSKAEGVDWLKRAPFDGGAEVEIRQIFELEDFGDSEAVEKHRELQKQTARTKKR